MLRYLALLCLFSCSPAVASAADSVSFGRRAAQSGDAVEQSVRVEMQIESTARQGAKVIETSASRVDRTQTRRVTATDIVGGRVVGAEVRFFDATTIHNDAKTEEPVSGKTYHCRRDGDRLTITTAAGTLPPMAEYEVVARAMETLGTASPLAKFLAGRTVRVGERIELPSELAQQALGFDKQMGEVDRFTLRLTRVNSIAGRRVARFDAEIEAHGATSEQMRLIIAGVFELEETTCRIVSADLAGPIAISGLRGPDSQSGYTLDGRGKMHLELAARYRDATR